MELIIRIIHGLTSRLRIFFYRFQGVRIDGHCWLRAIEIPRGHRDIVLETGVALDRGCALIVSGESTGTPKLVIGRLTYVNRYTILDASEDIRVGEECMIGPHCYITDHDHTISAAHAPGQTPLKSLPTRIEDRCWLGAHVTVLKGVTIGRGTVVGAGSVVTKSLPPGVIAVGSPAHVIKKIEQ